MKQSIKIEPIFPLPYTIQTIWAGNRMGKIRSGIEEHAGIYREVCTYRDNSNLIQGGQFNNRVLADVVKQYHQKIIGNDKADQLLRLAYMDTVKDLSIQVHPQEHYAKEVENDDEKTESWYILDCNEDAYVIAGTTATEKAEMQRLIQSNTIESQLVKLPVKPGDCVLIPAGLLHACGKNILALEIGSFGGITYRVYDYGRGRALDLEKAMDVLDLTLRATKRSFPLDEYVTGERQRAIEHRLFCVDIIEIDGKTTICPKNKYQILTNVGNEITIQIDDKKYQLPYTASVIIPACVEVYDMIGKGRLLLSYRPD